VIHPKCSGGGKGYIDEYEGLFNDQLKQQLAAAGKKAP